VKGKPVVNLSSENGNAYNLIAQCRKAARMAKWTPEHIEAVTEEMKAGDYDHLLQTAMKHFKVE
jgi:hypothetical protein